VANCWFCWKNYQFATHSFQRIMQISPSTHFVSFAQAVLYRGAGFDMVWKDCAVIAALGLAFFGIALVHFRHMVAKMQT